MQAPRQEHTRGHGSDAGFDVSLRLSMAEVEIPSVYSSGSPQLGSPSSAAAGRVGSDDGSTLNPISIGAHGEENVRNQGQQEQDQHQHHQQQLKKARAALERLQFYQVVFAQRPLSKQWFCCFSSSPSPGFPGGEEEYEGADPAALATTLPTMGTACRVGSDLYRIVLLAVLFLDCIVSVVSIVETSVGMIDVSNHLQPIFIMWLPICLGFLACLVSSLTLPSKFKAAADDIVAGTSPSPRRRRKRGSRPPLDLDDIDWAGRRAGCFAAAWLIIGIIGFGVHYNDMTLLLIGIFGFFMALPSLCGIFFVYALDVSKIKKEIRELEMRTRDMSLTLKDYKRSQRYIEGVSGTRRSQFLLSAVALYNLVGLLAHVYSYLEQLQEGNIPAGAGDADHIDGYFFLTFFFGKEASLFLAFAYLAMVVNDAADDVCTEVYLWPTSEGGNDEKDEDGNDDEDDNEEEEDQDMGTGVSDALADRRRRRVEIIAQMSTFVGPRQRKHRGESWRRVSAPKAGPISFDVLGVRWTSSYVQALLVSLGTALLGALTKRYE